MAATQTQREFVNVNTKAGNVRFLRKPNGVVMVFSKAFSNRFKIVPSTDSHGNECFVAHVKHSDVVYQAPTAERAYKLAARNLLVA